MRRLLLVGMLGVALWASSQSGQTTKVRNGKPGAEAGALKVKTSAPAPGSLTNHVSPLADPRGIHPGLSPVPAAQRARARALIRRVRVAAQGSHAGYDRDAFGAAWDDDTPVTWGRNGCQTRKDILHRDFMVTGGGCAITTTLSDPYTGQQVAYEDIEIDHVIALSYAWDQGAKRWSQARRQQLANDPLNLIATHGPTNQAKGDSGLAEWMPPNPEMRCAISVRTAKVSLRYDLPIRRWDQRAMTRSCS